MKFSPKTEAEVAEAGLLPPGIYPFEVLEAEEKQSKAGNDMIALKLSVVDNEGSARGVFDYLLESVEYKLRHFADAVGLLSEYEQGTLPADDLVGRTGQCKLRIDPAKNGYNAKNSVADYVKRDGAVPGVVAKNGAASNGARDPMDDEIPF